MFELSSTPRVFALPIGADFSRVFLDGLLHRLREKPPHDIARITIFVNTRRTERRLRELFISSGASLLPRIHLISDITNDPFGLCTLPPPASPLKRKLQLGQLIRQLLKADPELAPVSATYDLAQSLAGLMDEVQGEGVSMKSVLDLDVGDHSAHWERSKKFLSILAAHWDQHALTDTQDRMRHVVDTYASYWQENPPAGPILVVGSTGSRGETALFMKAVSSLPNGAVVLPGFDKEMPDDVWESFLGKQSTLDHPQAGFAKLLAFLNINHKNVRDWHTATGVNSDRNQLVSLALRPAPITDQWLKYGPSLSRNLGLATQKLELLEAATPKEEALAIATRLRYAAEQDKEAVLITPSRDLSRRVSAALARWDIEADDSAGIPLQLSPPGVFLRSIADCFGKPIAPHKLLSLLKHVLTNSGRERNLHNLMTQQLEVGTSGRTKILRGGPPFVDFDLLSGWAKNDAPKIAWAAWLKRIFKPLEHPQEMDLPDWIRLHLLTAQSLSDGPQNDGNGKVWERDAGIATLRVLSLLQEQSSLGGRMTVAEYNALLRSVLDEDLRPERQTANPLISIWGTLEARVQSKDLVILGGLNEGIWPAKPAHDMWLNRDMRKQLGLLLPERRIGLSAHDFQQAVAAPSVVLSRSERDGDSPSTPSRWLIRLTNLMEGLKDGGPDALSEMRERGHRWVKLARSLDRAQKETTLATRPSPMPPKGARLTKLSVTQVKDLVRDPYKIYASVILNLRKLDPLGKQADAMERGTAIHDILEEFICKTKASLPEDAVGILMTTAEEVLEKEVPWPAAQRLWLARLAGVADWFISQERKRREDGEVVFLERKGEMVFEDLGFRLTVKADRIDRGRTGLRLYDYKASKPPADGDIKYFDKQLQLEAMIAANNGFDGLEESAIEHLRYIGMGPELKETILGLEDNTITEIWEEFRALVLTYNDPSKGFTARDKVQLIKHASDYDHLSRKGEWQDSDEPDPRPVP
jgi:double-strand break repair protein AddB